MGNSQSCCIYSSSHREDRGDGTASKGKGKGKRQRRANGGQHSADGLPRHHRDPEEYGPGPGGREGSAGTGGAGGSSRREESVGNLPHISEREPDDWEEDPSLHPMHPTLFMEKSKQAIQSKRKIRSFLFAV